MGNSVEARISDPRAAGDDGSSLAQLERTVLVEGLSVFLLCAGSGQPVLLLHGWGGTSDTWSHLFHRLAEHHSVYALDLPGSGRTPLPEPAALSLDDFVRIVL